MKKKKARRISIGVGRPIICGSKNGHFRILLWDESQNAVNLVDPWGNIPLEQLPVCRLILEPIEKK